MRGIYTAINDIRHRVFTEVARFAYSDDHDYKKLEQLPYQMLPGEEASYRESIFLERAIIGERLRLTMGLPLRSMDQHAPLSEGLENCEITEKYYEPPLVNVIKFACNACPDNQILVTEACQGCLAHPCQEVCPKKAITIRHGKSVINPDLCIQCGRCTTVCPYGAIVRQERPCSKACGMDAIESDEQGRAKINYDKCVSCGMCLVNCPFGAIADKSQIFQLINAMQKGEEVIAIIAPAFVGQFGPKLTPDKIRPAFQALGFADVEEVAIGADLCTVEEAKDFLREVPEKQPFMATSCCPSWSVMAKKLFPEFSDYISMAMTPMVLTARMIKQNHPNAKICFIGPCAAKKLEASRHSVRSNVDFVLTFEETMGMFEAKKVDFAALPKGEPFTKGSSAGRAFAVSGGVADAVVEAAKVLAPDREIKVASAQGLKECRKMLQLAKAGKYDGYLLEGMGCPGGCVAGAGTIQAVSKSTTQVNLYKKQAPVKGAMDSEFHINLGIMDAAQEENQ